MRLFYNYIYIQQTTSAQAAFRSVPSFLCDLQCALIPFGYIEVLFGGQASVRIFHLRLSFRLIGVLSAAVPLYLLTKAANKVYNLKAL